MALLLPALLLGAAVAWQAVEGQRMAVEARLRDTARGLALAVDRELGGVIAALDGFATSPAFGPDASAPDLPTLDAQARRLAARIGGSLELLGRDGELLIGTQRQPGGPLPRLASREFTERVFASGATTVGDLARSVFTGRPVVPIGVPVHRADESVALVAGASLPAERLHALLAAQRLPQGFFAAVADARHVLVARSDSEHDAVVGRTVPEGNAARFAGRAEGGIFRGRAMDGSDRVFAFHPVPAAPGWTVFVAAPAEVLSTAWSAPLVNIAGGGAIALLLGGLLARGLARRILLPVRRLGDHARAIGEACGPGGANAGTLPPAEVAEFEQLRQGFAAAEAALGARELDMAGVLEASGQGVLVLDREWCVTFVGGLAQAWVGAGQELRGRSLWDIFPEAVGGPFWDAFRRSMAERVAAHADAVFPTLGRHIEAESHPRPDGGLVLLLRDMTDARAAAARLEEGEARFRAMADNIPQLAWMAQPDGWIFWYNKRWYDFTGTTPEEMQGWGWRSVHHPDHVERVVAFIAEAFARGEPWEDTFPMRGADGAYHWFLTRAMPVRDAAGRIAMWFGTNTDVTEERAAQAELRANEVRLRLALEAGRIGTFVWDLGDGALAWDERMRALWGVPPDAPADAATLRAGLQEQDLPLLEAALASACDPATGGRFELECRVIAAADGAERHVVLHGRVEFADGQARRMIGTASDVTPLKRAAQVLAREAEQLEILAERRGRALAESEARLAAAARMEALGRLAGGIAHDFNNVLQAVQGGLRLAEKRLAGDPGAVRRYLAMASDAAARGAAVTGRLLSFARRGELHAEAVAPAPLLEGLAEMLRATLGPGIAIRVEADAGLPALWADRSQLEAVLVNLANNARDAVGGAGVILLRAEAGAPPPDLSDAGPLPRPCIRLSVHDTGMGMSSQVLARVTEPFFTTKPKGKGTGLGLAMARGFAEQSGGAIGIESTPGQGTTVSLWLPQAEAADLSRVVTLGAQLVPGEKSSPLAALVLLAEDEREVREILATELTERGFTVVATETGMAALARLEGGLRPDAVVTDLAMPGGMDGLDLLREARRHLPRLPGVLVTGHAGDAAPELLEAAERAGPFALVRKPAAADVLADRLGRVLGQGRATAA
jgi:PAS domain S-box-containing protein